MDILDFGCAHSLLAIGGWGSCTYGIAALDGLKVHLADGRQCSRPGRGSSHARRILAGTGRAKLHHTAGSAGSDQPAATYQYDVFTRLMALGWDLSAPLKLCVVNPKD